MTNFSDEKFCLRWNDFETNISSAFKDIREDKDFFDVTIACDNNQIQAHKVILSACSPFFRYILKQHPHQHPLLYLKGVRYEDISSVLNFMYHGEVNVAHDDLNTFLAVAEDLKVKGLTQSKPKEVKTVVKEKAASKVIHIDPLSSKDERHVNNDQFAVQTIPPEIKSERHDTEEEDTANINDCNEYQMQYDDYQEGYEEQEQYDQLTVPETSRNYNSGWTNTPKPFPCSYCSKSFANQNSLQKHTKSHTGQTYCNLCDKNFSNVPNLRAHISTVHRT